MGEAKRRGTPDGRRQAAMAAGRTKSISRPNKLYQLPIAMKSAISTALGPLARAAKITEQ
jgi:hypothetical protein